MRAALSRHPLRWLRDVWEFLRVIALVVLVMVVLVVAAIVNEWHGWEDDE